MRQHLHSFLEQFASTTSHISPSRLFFFRGLSSKLFVKGLSFSTTEETLTEAFSKFGEVVEAEIVKKKDKSRSKGFGFVAFATSEAAKKAVADMNGKALHGRVLYVDHHLRADPKERRQSLKPES